MARFGRTDWADFSFPDDAAMADVHFQIEWKGSSLRLRHLAVGAATTVNGKPAAEGMLRSGDRIAAGRTTFLVELDGVEEDVAAEASGGGKAGGPTTRSRSEWVALLTQLGVDAEALVVPQDGQSSDDLVAALIAADLPVPAARLRAHELEARGAVWWALRALDQFQALPGAPPLDAVQQSAVAAARAWVAQPTDGMRRAAEGVAQAAEFNGKGGMLATAVYLSGGSLAPADSPAEAPPDPRITGRLVAGLLQLCDAEARMLGAELWPSFFDDAAQLVAGPIAWPAPAA